MIIKKYLVNLSPPSSSITENSKWLHTTSLKSSTTDIRGPASWIVDQQAMFT